jgi:phospholipid/cholesterol/gamma-HCH transport system permease protein
MASVERQLRNLIRRRTDRPWWPRITEGNGHGPSLLGRGLKAANRPFENFVELLRFSVRAIKAMPRALRYRKVIALVVSDITIGVGALVVGAGTFFVIFAMSFFTGTQVGLEGYQGLSQIGAQAFTGLVSSWANTREITPLVAGVALAAQVGTSFTAELGAARISEEIDALEVMAVPSLHYMVATRIWAAIITIIPLYLAALFSSYLSTQLIVTKFFTLSSGTYLHYFHLFLPPIDIFYSLVKAVLFAIVVTLIHCYYGYNASGGPAGVGVASGRAIRASIVTVVVLNLFLSLLFWGGHDTVQIAG